MYDSENKKIILFFGRINKIKGLDFQIKAYDHLINKMNYHNSVFVIVGPDDGYLDEAKRLVNSLKLSKSIIFTGPLYEKDI